MRASWVESQDPLGRRQPVSARLAALQSRPDVRSITADLSPPCYLLPLSRSHPMVRSLLLAAAVLIASPAFAKGTKGPAAGRYCKKSKVGTTVQDKAGNTLECKLDGKRTKWMKK
jgi:hypothetical protein